MNSGAPPIKTVGILGGGQLARMLALAGYPLGLRFRVYDPAAHPCAADVADHCQGAFDELQKLQQFSQGLDIITYEFENIPYESALSLAQHRDLQPSPEALRISQDRKLEKVFLRTLGIPVADFEVVSSKTELKRSLERIGFPAVLKSRVQGYDGRGQAIIRSPEESDQCWDQLGNAEMVLERFIRFERELSIVAVRTRGGEISCYPLSENHHAQGILRCSLAPAPNLSPSLQSQAETLVTRILTELNYVGVLTLELFEYQGRLLANEFAPRVHNSGHWTIEGAETSQFENHLRAILNLPLGSTTAIGASVLKNIVGTLPPLNPILELEGARLHLYAKKPQPGRKLGHVNLRVSSVHQLEDAKRRLENAIAEESFVYGHDTRR